MPQNRGCLSWDEVRGERGRRDARRAWDREKEGRKRRNGGRDEQRDVDEETKGRERRDEMLGKLRH